MNNPPRGHGVHFSMDRDDWETPGELFSKLDKEFIFGLDAAAEPDNTKVPWNYYTKRDDGLSQPWTGVSAAWCNPPYGRTVGAWLAKGREAARAGTTSVFLLPARTDTKWFHEYVWDASENCPQPGVEVRFVKGRIKFVGAEQGAPFPSVIIVFRGTIQHDSI